MLELPDHDEHRGALRLYFGQKYTKSEVTAVRSTIDLALPSYSESEKRQATAEILAFSDVIYRLTSHHDLRDNHNAIRKHEKNLRGFCQTYQIPHWPVLAITSWENSGSSAKVSWADAAGLGQMTPGAIDQAHRYAHELASDPKTSPQLRERLEKIERLHAYQAKLAKLPDERFLPEANLEDVVLFFKYLYSQYGERADHAIGAYHKGLANQDDIIKDYLVRKEGSCPDPVRDRSGFIAAIGRNSVTYLTLWNDTRCREMLNGMRTLDGDPTTPYNASEALGDESDIYPWKVLGSLSGFLQGESYVADHQQVYVLPQSEVEVSGIPKFKTAPDIEQALKQGQLVRLKLPIQDLGVTYNVSQAHQDLAFAVAPELEGYLQNLTQRWRKRANDPTLLLPVRRLLAVGDMAEGKNDILDQAQLRGITFQLDTSKLEKEQKAALEHELKTDYLLDRVYQNRTKDKEKHLLVCLNPRFGYEFLDYRKDYLSKGENPPSHTIKPNTKPSKTPDSSASRMPTGEHQSANEPANHDGDPKPHSGPEL